MGHPSAEQHAALFKLCWGLVCSYKIEIVRDVPDAAQCLIPLKDVNTTTLLFVFADLDRSY